MLPVYKSKATPEERHQKMLFMEQQVELICDQHRIGTPIRFVKMRCGCGKLMRLINMFRCLYCGLYYCRECAEQHFGMKSERAGGIT